MKYFWALLISVLVLTACDDGDVIENNFNFGSAAIQKCSDSNLLYKINAKEALILNTPETSFPNNETPLSIPISSTTSITYRKFSANTSTSNICGVPTLPVIEEWGVIGGTVEIATNKIYDTAGTTVVAYNHKITFKNITFITANKQIVYDTYEFGNYRTEVIDLHFNYTTAVTQNCSGNNLIFKYNSSNALLLDVDPTLFNHILTAGTPKTRLINTTTNKVVYRVYNGGLNANFFCSAITPATPTLTEEWVAEDGVAGVSGIITVDTEATANPSIFKHTIKLYKTTFKKGIGEYSPNPDGDYLFGEFYN